MPCDRIRWTRIVQPQTNEGLDIKRTDLLAKALEGLGFCVTKTDFGLTIVRGYERGSFANGVLRFPSVIDADAVRIAYGKECVKEAARINKWTLTETGENTYKATRRAW